MAGFERGVLGLFVIVVSKPEVDMDAIARGIAQPLGLIGVRVVVLDWSSVAKLVPGLGSAFLRLLQVGWGGYRVYMAIPSWLIVRARR